MNLLFQLIFKDLIVNLFWFRSVLFRFAEYNKPNRLCWVTFLGHPVHFSNNITDDEIMNERLYAVRPIMEHSQATLKELFYHNRDISVGESMMRFKGYLARVKKVP